MCRLLAPFLVAIVMLSVIPASRARADGCGFVLGFAAIEQAIPDIVGGCLDNEGHNPANGDGLQHTTHGLLVWRKADNFTAFTDGYRTWVNGPNGIQERLNTQRFPWEAQSGPAAPAMQPAGGAALPLFGLSVDPYLTATVDPARPIWPNVPFSIWRTWDAHLPPDPQLGPSPLVTWADLEPAPGDWHFAALDRLIDLAQEQHVEVLLTLGMTPQWASSQPNQPSDFHQYGIGNGWAAPPTDDADWRTYVHTLAARYAGRVQYYEVWNEPDLPNFWTGSPEQMVRLEQIAKEEIQAVDPNAKLVSPSISSSSGLGWLERYLAAGGGQAADILGYHIYFNPNRPNPEGMLSQINALRSTLQAPGLQNKPIWGTEIGWETPPKGAISPDALADYVPRSYVLAASARIARLIWYIWDNTDGYGLAGGAGGVVSPTAATANYAQIEQWLTGAQVQRCRTDVAQQIWQCPLQRDDGQGAVVVWDAVGSTAFPIPSAWGVQTAQTIDGITTWLGGAASVQIGPTPLLLSPVSQAALPPDQASACPTEAQVRATLGVPPGAPLTNLSNPTDPCVWKLRRVASPMTVTVPVGWVATVDMLDGAVLVYIGTGATYPAMEATFRYRPAYAADSFASDNCALLRNEQNGYAPTQPGNFSCPS